MAKVLVLSVGKTAAPLTMAVKYLQPDRVIFFCSAGTVDLVLNEENPFKVYNNAGEIVKEFPNLPAQMQLGDRFLADRDLIEVDSSENPAECYQAAARTFENLLRSYRHDDILVDHTGGTKIMSTALAIAAMDYGVELYFTPGFRDTTGNDFTTFLVSPSYLNLHTRIQQFLPASLQGYHYAAAIAQLNGFLQRSSSQEAAQAMIHLRDCCRAFECWDRFEYAEAWGLLQRFARYPQIEPLAHFLRRVMACRAKWVGVSPPSGSLPGHGYELIEDLIRNAERRAGQQRFDDAILRVRRAFELLTQIHLKHLNPDEEPPNTDNQEVYQRMQKLPDDPLGKLYQQQADSIQQAFTLGSQGLLGGGQASISASDYTEFDHTVITFLRRALTVVRNAELKEDPEQIVSVELLEFPPQFPQQLVLERDTSQRTGSDVLTQLQQKARQGDYDIFISFQTRNTHVVRELGARLKPRGLLPWFDEWTARPDENWQDLADFSLGRFQALAICVGSEGMQAWQPLQEQALFQQALDVRCPIIPILLPGFEGEASVPAFFQTSDALDIRDEQPQHLEKLLQRMRPSSDGANIRKIDVKRDYIEHVEGNVFMAPVYYIVSDDMPLKSD